MIRKSARTLRDLWIYFKTGHSGYLVYSMSLLNFVVIQHRMLISYIPILAQYLSRLGTFFMVFMFTYIPLAIVIGFFEFRKGEVRRRPMLNPYTQDILEANMNMYSGLMKYFDGDTETAKQQLEESISLTKKWILKKTPPETIK